MRKSSRNLAVPRPFLKWAGGKGQLLEELAGRVQAAQPFGRYHEPFVGGGALFFGLTRSGALEGRQAHLSDNNAPLVEAYQAVRDEVDGVIALLKEHKDHHSKAYYYQVRAGVPDTSVTRAARIIYLNRTCYNGLYRENSRGEFNVPLGRYEKPVICDEENLRAVAAALKTATIENRHFASILDRAVEGDFVYFDPPYHPVSQTASFTSYDRNGFGPDDQRHLAEVVAELTEKGIKVLLSNSMTDFVKELYSDFTIEEVFAARSVNSRADRRGKISEALVSNFALTPSD